MNSFIVRTAFATLFAALFAGCGDSSGDTKVAYSGGPFGYECNDYFVVVDLEATDAVLSKSRAGVDCDLGPDLEGRGCRFQAQEYAERSELQIAILDCPFALSEVLFRCGFIKGEISALNDKSYAGCCYFGEVCNYDVPVCFTDEASGATCEACDNDADDDADGLADCDDPYCRHAPECRPTTTTTTSTTVSSTTTTTDSTTTTTMLDYACDVRFRLVDTATAASLLWKTDYSRAQGKFAFLGDVIDCTGLVEGAHASFEDDPGGKILTSGVIRIDEPIEGPIDLVRCRFLSTESIEGEDFDVIEVEAVAPNQELIVPAPQIAAISVECGPIDLARSANRSDLPGSSSSRRDTRP